MAVLKRIVGFPLRIGGEQHTGWLPVNATVPPPTPVRDVVINVVIDFDDSGYLLCYESEDGSVYGDTWHETLAEAERAALEQFGVSSSQWQDV